MAAPQTAFPSVAQQLGQLSGDVREILTAALGVGGFVCGADNTFETTRDGVTYVVALTDDRQQLTVTCEDVAITYTTRDQEDFVVMMSNLWAVVRHTTAHPALTEEWWAFYMIYRCLREIAETRGSIAMKRSSGDVCQGMFPPHRDMGVHMKSSEGVTVPSILICNLDDSRNMVGSGDRKLSDLLELNADEIAARLPVGVSMDALRTRFADECELLNRRAASLVTSYKLAAMRARNEVMRAV